MKNWQKFKCWISNSFMGELLMLYDLNLHDDAKTLAEINPHMTTSPHADMNVCVCCQAVRSPWGWMKL